MLPPFLAACIDEGPSRVARIYGGVGLYEVLVRRKAYVDASHGAYDAHGYRLIQAEGVADCEDDVPRLQPARVPYRQCGRR